MTSNHKKPGIGHKRDSHPTPRRSLSPAKPPGRPSHPAPRRPSSDKSSAKRPERQRPAAHPGGRSGVPARRISRRPAARRPAARAVARKAAVTSRPMPSPPARRTISARRPAAVAGQIEALRAEVERIQSEFADLEGKAQLSSIYAAVGDFDARLVELPTTLETLRNRGYVHSGQLDDALEAVDDRWDEVRPRVESALRTHVQRLDRELDQTERRVNNLQANKADISAADSAISGLSRQVDAARHAVEGLYEGMDLQLLEISSKIAQIERMMDLIDQSQELRLLEAEGPLLAVEAEWHRDGKEGPEGVLFLTDQRLLFEQREEVVTKKVLGLFKAESEKTQDLLLNFQVREMESVTPKEEGGFLGMGKDDILELELAASAPVSRARFHLKGQDSDDWAAMIKRVQTGEIDDDREDEYVDELEEAESLASAFPSQCPNCFAELPAPPRGVSSVTCEFCGTVITPDTNSEQD